MYEAEVFNWWWLIPLILIGLCFFGCRGCCTPRGRYFSHSPDPEAGSALDILDRRYARGEIDEKEYRLKRDTITRTDQGETP